MSQELKERLMGAIKKGELSMRPRWHFVLRSSLVLVGVALVALAAVFVTSFIMFLLRSTGAIFVPYFGSPGLRSFLFALPWLLILLSLAFIVILELMARYYGSVRRTPLLYGAFSMIAFVLLASSVIESLSLHDRMALRAETGRLPFVGGMYR